MFYRKNFPALAIAVGLGCWSGLSLSFDGTGRQARSFAPFSPLNAHAQILTDPLTESSPSRPDHFVSIPRLQGIQSNRNRAAASWPRYYFTLEFPPSEGAGLAQLRIEQYSGQPVRLIPEEVMAFEGTRRDRGERLAIAIVQANPQDMTLAFLPPVQPGQTFTIGIRARANPWQGGIITYNLTAYSPKDLDSEFSTGVGLGVGRMSFLDPLYEYKLF